MTNTTKSTKQPSLYDLVQETPLEYSKRLSDLSGADVYLKREDLQTVRSYKIRGAYNFLLKLRQKQRQRGVVTASAGNHAQGVAQAARYLGTTNTIFVPTSTPQQKIDRIHYLGGTYSTVIVQGTTYDESAEIAKKYANKHNLTYIPPFDHSDIIEGQGTVAEEIIKQLPAVDYILCPVGGGGLCAGITNVLLLANSKARIVAVEPVGAACLQAAIALGKPTTLNTTDSFVDGAAVKRIGERTFKIMQGRLDGVETVSNAQLCQAMIDLYQHEGIITEPAGALSVSALQQVENQVAGKSIVCIISGGNNDITRYPEIISLALQHQEKPMNNGRAILVQS